MKSILKEWGLYAAVAVVALGAAAVVQWKHRLRAEAVAEHIRQQAADSIAKLSLVLEAEQEAHDLAMRDHAAAQFVADGAVADAEQAVQKYRALRAEVAALRAAAGDTGSVITTRTFLAAVDSTLAAADSLAAEVATLKTAMQAERAAADARFQADAAIIATQERLLEQKDVQIRQLEVLAANRPGALEQGLKYGGIVVATVLVVSAVK